MYIFIKSYFHFFKSSKDVCSRIVRGIIWITQIRIQSLTNQKYLSCLNHLEYLISTNENGCSGGFPVSCRGRIGALVERGHVCFTELSRQSPHTHHSSTQHGNSTARRHKKNAIHTIHEAFALSAYTFCSQVLIWTSELHIIHLFSRAEQYSCQITIEKQFWEIGNQFCAPGCDQQQIFFFLEKQGQQTTKRDTRK